MHLPSSTLSTIALFATTIIIHVHAHGLIQTPSARAVGPAATSACGSSIANTIKTDNTSHVEGLPEIAAVDSTYHASQCNLWLCKGLQYEDNSANVQTYTAGQVVDISVWLRIKHKGSANVSVVDTRTNEVVGGVGKGQLAFWGDYADEGVVDTPVNQTEFSVTIPEGLEETCKDGGNCVLQWWWYGTGAKQTYESCVDFKIAPNSSVPRSFSA